MEDMTRKLYIHILFYSLLIHCCCYYISIVLKSMGNVWRNTLTHHIYIVRLLMKKWLQDNERQH